MPQPLGYAGREEHPKTVALPAMTCGLVSGPFGYCLAFPVFDSHLSDSMKESRGILVLVGSLAGAFVFALVVRLRLPISASRRDRAFAVTGIVAPLLWLVAIFGFIVVASQRTGCRAN
jgi:hypothetical protein